VTIEARMKGGLSKSGTGFIVESSGTIVTSLHVVDGATYVEVKLATDEVYPVIGVKATDQRRDLAILQIGGFKLPVVQMGDSTSVRPGEKLIVIGNPLGFDHTVTAGIVSGIRDAGGFRVIQMDAAISPGNSGGPVVNERGEVIGVAKSKKPGGENINFAVPIHYARGLLTLPVNMGLGMLASTSLEEAPAPEQDTPPAPTAAHSLPEYWRSTSTANVKRLSMNGDRLFIENSIAPALRDAGALSTVELKKAGDHWVGVHRERINCRPMPLLNRKVCPLIELPMSITLLSPDRIEGVGEEPLNNSAFDCRRCSFANPPLRKPFVWLPQ
jgi:hypothetical protein